jgi:hypothetical protein
MRLGPPPTSVTPLRFSKSITIPSTFIGSMFTNNAEIYYKSHSLSAASTNGSGSRNSRAIRRRT